MKSSHGRRAAIAAASIAMLHLSGCASNPYHEPSGAAVASLHEFHTSEGLLTWANYRVAGVDGKWIAPPFWTSPGRATVKLEPGKHRLVIHAVHNRGWGDGPYEAFLPIGVTVEPGTTYDLHGELHENNVRVWIEKDHAVVTLVSEAGYRSRPQAPIVVPVVVPKR